MTKLIRYSPTQLSMFRACPRKWWFAYVAGFKPPQSKSQAEGSRIHTVIEKAFDSGKLPDDDRAVAAIAELARADAAGDVGLEARLKIAVASPQHMLDTAEGILREQHAYITIDEKREMFGKIDVVDLFSRKRPEVTDWKTMSDLKYALTEYELADNEQMNIYAKWALDQVPTADACLVRHIAIPTRGHPRAVPIEAVLTREHVESKWKSYLPILDNIEAVRLVKSASEVAAQGMKNGECEKYGGCPHTSRCTAAIFAPQKVELDMDAKARIAELKKKKEQAEAEETTPSKAASGGKPRQAKTSPEAGEREVPREEAQDKLARLRAAKKAGQSTPPPEVEAEADVEQEPEEDPKDKVARLRAQSKQSQADEDDRRAKKEAVRGREPTTTTDPKPSQSMIETLYVDCVPMTDANGLAHVMLEDWAQSAADSVREATGVSWKMHKYREGTGPLCEYVDALPAPSELVVDTSTDLGQVLLDVLIPRAQRVVRGFAR